MEHREKMEFFRLCIIFIVFYTAFDWIIKKVDIHRKIFDNPRRRKYVKFLLVLILIIFIFSLQYVQYELQERFGKHSYISIGEAAFLGATYTNFGQYIWKRSKK